MPRPVIALLTDFGLTDHYVAAMKGVMLGICPDATLVDITHDVPPQDIVSGALELEAVVRYLPAGTIVIGVVDPGVGSRRRGVAIDASGLRFVGPDNGLFSLALHERATNAVELTERRYALHDMSRTFEGRDRFAPAAAWLATGVALSALGPAVRDLVALDIPQPTTNADAIDGVVLRVDHFGNLVTNIPRTLLGTAPDRLAIHVGGATLDRVSGTYAEVAPGALCAMVGSTERLEISVNGGSAAIVLNAARGTPVHVRARAGA